MTETKFTHAPWKLEKTMIGIMITAYGADIAEIVGISDIEYANANLISAAPDLYKMLAEIVSKWDEETAYFESIGLKSNYKEEIEKARKVLAKARGE